MMPGDFGLVYPPWNHSRKPGDLLERVVGEVRLDHLTVPAITGEVTQFRLSGDFESPYFHTEGGWHFPPQTKLYAASGVRPRPAKWFGTRDLLDQIRQRCEKLGLKLILRIDLPRVRGIVEHSPELRGRSAWGDELASGGPCVWNPGFRELVQATLSDLARYEPAGFEVQGVSMCTVPFAAGTLPFLLPRLGGQVTLCFCAGCRQVATQAGVDAEAAAQFVRGAGERLADDPSLERFTPEARPSDWLYPREPELKGYHGARTDDLRRWLDRLAESHSSRRMLFVHDRAFGQLWEEDEAIASPRWTTLVRVIASVLQPNVGGVGFEAETGKRKRGLSMPIWNPGVSGSDDLVRYVSLAAGSGVEFFEFELLEESPAQVITWLKQAVRYARRG